MVRRTGASAASSHLSGLSGAHTASSASLPTAGKYSDLMTPRQKRTAMVTQAMGQPVPSLSSRLQPQPPPSSSTSTSTAAQPPPHAYSMLSTEKSASLVQVSMQDNRRKQFDVQQMSKNLQVSPTLSLSIFALTP